MPPGSGPYKFLLTDYDYARAITKIEHQLQYNHNITLHYHHIYSHLDDPEKRNKLLQKIGSNLLATYLSKTIARAINNACDEEATTHQQTTSRVFPSPVIYMESYFIIDNLIMPSNNFSNIYQRIQKHTYLTYLTNKFQWQELDIQNINWQNLGKALSTIPQTKRATIGKYIHKWRPTHKKLHQISHPGIITPTCPICAKEEDTDNHCFSCDHWELQQEQLKALERLRQKLQKIKTYPIITQTITSHIYAWMRNIPPRATHFSISNPLHLQVQKAITIQNSIGWDQMVRGRISKLWTTTQKIYHKERNKNNTRWAQHTIKALWDFGGEVWTKRNTIKYGTTEEIESSEKSKMKPIILQHYQNQDTVSIYNQKLFQTPLQTRLTFSSKDNKQWLKMVQIAQKQHKIHTIKTQKSIPPITTYFSTSRPPHSHKKLQPKSPLQQITTQLQNLHLCFQHKQLPITNYIFHRPTKPPTPTSTTPNYTNKSYNTSTKSRNSCSLYPKLNPTPC